MKPSPNQETQSTINRLMDHYRFDTIPIEGTLYKSTYVSKQQAENGPMSTAILGMYCHDPLSVSYFHRLTYDEVWHFYDGDPFFLHLLHANGEYQKIIMGNDVLQGHKVQTTVPALCWQAGELIKSGKYALFGCTMSPGFTGSCFEGGTESTLINAYPKQIELIRRLSITGDETRMGSTFSQ